MAAFLRYSLVGIVSLITTFNATAAPTDTLVRDAGVLFTAALVAERAEQWDKAVDLHLKAYLAGRRTAEVREHIHDSLRHAAQARRHRDPAFQQFVLSLPPAEALNLYADVIGKLETYYAEREKSRPERLFALGLEELDRALSDESFRRTHLPMVNLVKLAQFRRSLSEMRMPTTAKETRAAVRELARVAQTDLGLANTSAVVLECLCGACGGLDEYTVYLTPSQVRSEGASPIVTLAAYGLLVAIRDGAAIIDSILPESWAALRTSLKAGDRILRANGRSVDGNPNSLAEALRNPGAGGHDLDTLSGTAHLPTPLPTILRAEILNSMAGVGYIKLATFRDSTANELDQAVLSLKARGMRSLILDLRGNAGGSFPAGVRVAERFLPAGIIATTQGQASTFADRVFSSASGMSALDVPLVLLVDGKTMSAAEVVASAMKEHRRATLVGMPTFGKGAVQTPLVLTAPEEDHPKSTGMLVVTIARIFNAVGAPLHGVGVVPDLVEADTQRQLTIAMQRAVEVTGATP